MTKDSQDELNDFVQSGIASFESALALARQNGDKRAEAENLYDLGIHHYHFLQDMPTAIEHFDNALAIAREIGDKGLEADSLIGLGDGFGFWFWVQRDEQKAIDLHHQALSLAREIGDKQREGDFLRRLGSITKDPTKAVPLFEEALSLAHQTGNKRAESDCLDKLGTTNRRLGNYEQAIQYIEQSITISKTLEERSDWLIGYCTGHLAEVYYDMKDYQKASELYEQGLAIARQVDDDGEAAFRSRFDRLKSRINEALGTSNE